jgi:hypothetical protein
MLGEEMFVVARQEGGENFVMVEVVAAGGAGSHSNSDDAPLGVQQGTAGTTRHRSLGRPPKENTLFPGIVHIFTSFQPF